MLLAQEFPITYQFIIPRCLRPLFRYFFDMNFMDIVYFVYFVFPKKKIVDLFLSVFFLSHSKSASFLSTESRKVLPPFVNFFSARRNFAYESKSRKTCPSR